MVGLGELPSMPSTLAGTVGSSLSPLHSLKDSPQLLSCPCSNAVTVATARLPGWAEAGRVLHPLKPTGQGSHGVHPGSEGVDKRPLLVDEEVSNNLRPSLICHVGELERGFQADGAAYSRMHLSGGPEMNPLGLDQGLW